MNARTAYLVKEEADKVKARLGQCPNQPQRAITLVTRRILLDGEYYYEGNRINPVARSLGAGVWEVSHKPI